MKGKSTEVNDDFLCLSLAVTGDPLVTPETLNRSNIIKNLLLYRLTEKSLEGHSLQCFYE